MRKTTIVLTRFCPIEHPYFVPLLCVDNYFNLSYEVNNKTRNTTY